VAGLDHVSAPVRDIDRARDFYGAALAAIGGPTMAPTTTRRS